MNIDQGQPLSESLFYNPVVYLLGKVSGFKPYVGVPPEKITEDVLRLVGIDPEEAPKELAESRQRSVHAAWYHQTRQFRPGESAFCGKPIRGNPDDWSLTAIGVARAKELSLLFDGQLSQLSAGPNLTATWIGDRYDLLVSRITKHLNRKMPRSVEFGKIDDHIHDFFANKIANDGFRKALESGRNLPPSTVAFFARRSAYSDLRDEGREPVCRVFHGALTKNEIEDHSPSNWTEVVIPISLNTSDILQVNTYAEHSEEDQTADPMEFLASHFTVEEEVNNADAMEKILDLLSNIIRSEISGKHNPEWHEQLMIDKFIHGMSIREIAETHGMNYESDRNKIMLALDRVRKAVTRRHSLGQFSEFLSR
jgi:DNA-directed RNA polymerase specialized sigma24 family protein